MNDWLDEMEYPFIPRYYNVDGHQLHYVEEGEGNTILFVHGTPSWSFDFRNPIKYLSKNFRCIAIDHIGFGLSDKPERYDYSVQRHSKTLENFILGKDLTDLTLVVHDFGGPIGLDVAIRNPDRIKNLVILNSWMWSSASDPDYIRLRKVLKSPLLPWLYRYLNFSPRFLLPRSFGERKLSSKLHRQYIRPFADKTQRNGTLAFARSLLNDQDWFEGLWNKRVAIQNKPVLFIWGMKDPVIKPHYLEKFMRGFQHSRVIKLETTGHFPQEEQPKLVAQAMSVWMNESKFQVMNSSFSG